jgi:chitinase
MCIVDWEHPSDPRQGYHYVQLLAAVRKSLPTPQYLLTSALPAGEWVLKNIDLGKAAAYLDLVNLMTYDFSGPWTDACGHHAQLYSPKNPHNDAARVSCDSAVTYVTLSGVPSRKILLGVPTYGRSFLGASKLGDRFHGGGGEEGTFEYKDLPRSGADVQLDEGVGAVYSIGGDGGFVTYDDPRTVQMKAEFAKQQGLGGLFYWTGTGDVRDDRSLVQTGYRALQSS